MSKIRLNLKLKGLYAIKHALQKQLAEKELLNTACSNETLIKDITYESKLLEEITNIIKKYKVTTSI